MTQLTGSVVSVLVLSATMCIILTSVQETSRFQFSSPDILNEFRSSMWTGLVIGTSLCAFVVLDIVDKSKSHVPSKKYALNNDLLSLFPLMMLIVALYMITTFDVSSRKYSSAIAIQLTVLANAVLLKGLNGDVTLRSHSSIYSIIFTTINCVLNYIWFVVWTDSQSQWVVPGVVLVCISVAIFTGRSFSSWKSTFKMQPVVIVDDRVGVIPGLQHDSNECGSKYYCGYSMLTITAWALLAFPRQYPRGVAFYTNYEYLISVAALISFVLNERNSKNNMEQTFAAADTNRAFTRYISHELRSHLSHLSMGLDQLSDEVDGRVTAHKMITELQDSCESSIQILDDILIFASLQERVSRLSVCELRVKSLISGAVNEMESLVSADNWFSNIFLLPS